MIVFRQIDGTVLIYCENLGEIDNSINRGASKKLLNAARIGNKVLFSFDEVKRTLAVCSAAAVFTLLLACLPGREEGFRGIWGRGRVLW